MKLIDVLETIKYSDVELDLKVCYDNEFGEECSRCATYVPEEAFKEGKKYWCDYRVIKYSVGLPVKELERYHDFEVSMLKAEGKNHFFIFACNFH